MVRFWGRHRIAGALLLVVLALLVGAVVDLLRMRWHLDDGREALSGLQLDNLNDGLVPTIEGAAGHLRKAEAISDSSPFLSVLGVVPGVHDQVEGLRDLTDVTHQLGRTATRSASAIDVVLQEAGGDPTSRVRLLDTVLEELDHVESTIEDLDIGATGRLIGPLADARAELVEEVEDAPARLDEARFYVGGLRRLLAGPSRYLLLGANNAEMRGGAGMPLSAGVVTIKDGDIEFGEFKQLADVAVGQPEVEYPESWNNTYFRWAIGRDYLETAVSPNFRVTGPMYQDMAVTAGFGPVDGVLEIDAVALRRLLEVIGPVELDGVSYDASNIEQQVLNENYLRFDTISEGRGNRVELQSALAKAIFDAFKERDVPVAELALGLREAAYGRHLLAHSTDPAVQSLWESIGADGSLDAAGLMVTAQNVAANKLDWYIDPQVTLNVLPDIDGSWKARLTVRVENPEVERTSPQVDGTYDNLTNGTHRTMVAVYLPRGAHSIRSLDQPFTEQGYDPPLQMAAKRFEIPRGDGRSVAMEFSLPKNYIGTLIIPSGRVRPVQYTVNGQLVTDAVPTPVFWVQPDEPDKTPGAAAVAGVLALAGALAVSAGVRPRIRIAAERPMRAVPELALRAPPFGLMLFLSALGVLVAGALISAAS